MPAHPDGPRFDDRETAAIHGIDDASHEAALGLDASPPSARRPATARRWRLTRSSTHHCRG